jgi:uncharacterized protein (DUF983 family)
VEPSPQPLTTGRLLGRGLTRRCSFCGSRDAFDGYFKMKERCPRCNFEFDRIEGQRAGALGINTIVTFGLLAVVVVVGLIVTYPEFDLSVLLPAAVATAVVTPIVFYPFSRSLWNSIDLAMRSVTPDDDVDPRWIPPPPRRPRR